MRQKVQIKTKIVADQDCTINKLEKIRYDLFGQRCILHHLLRNTGKFSNEWRKTTTRIEQALERIHDLATTHTHCCYFNYAIRPWSQSSCLGIEYRKVHFIEQLLCHTPGHKRPERL